MYVSNSQHAHALHAFEHAPSHRFQVVGCQVKLHHRGSTLKCAVLNLWNLVVAQVTEVRRIAHNITAASWQLFARNPTEHDHSALSFTQLLVPLLLWKCVQCFHSTWSCAFSLIISSHAKSLHTVFSEPLFPLRSWKMPEDKISWKFLLKMEQPFVTVFVIFHGDLHFLKLWQALEGSCGLQHGEVIVVETPVTIIERDHREEDGGKQHHKGKSDFGMCACFVLSAHPCSRNPHTHVNTDIQVIVWHSVCVFMFSTGNEHVFEFVWVWLMRVNREQWILNDPKLKCMHFKYKLIPDKLCDSWLIQRKDKFHHHHHHQRNAQRDGWPQNQKPHVFLLGNKVLFVHLECLSFPVIKIVCSDIHVF